MAQAIEPDHTPEFLELQADTIRSTCVKILGQYGTPESIASVVVDDLLDAERESYPTHGLLRLIEYVSAIKGGAVQPAQEPSVTFSSNLSRMIDGHKGFGVIVAKRVVTELEELLLTSPLAVVGVANSNHLGRLAHIGNPLAKKGFFVIGFVNYFGPGRQKVAPWRGAAGRLCTNPVLIAVPTGSGEPIVVDISTSTVAEGKIRLALYNGNTVPDGWLVDKSWHPVNDPSRLYTDSAFLTPLGGDQGHKGFALGLVVDILAGILTGAGFSQANPTLEGSGGLFIGLCPSVLGRAAEDVFSEVNRLAEYCSDCPTSPDSPPVRIPGQRSPNQVCADDIYKVSMRAWQAILALEKLETTASE